MSSPSSEELTLDFDAPPGLLACFAQGCNGGLVFVENTGEVRPDRDFQLNGWVLECDACDLVVDVTVRRQP